MPVKNCTHVARISGVCTLLGDMLVTIMFFLLPLFLVNLGTVITLPLQILATVMTLALVVHWKSSRMIHFNFNVFFRYFLTIYIIAEVTPTFISIFAIRLSNVTEFDDRPFGIIRIPADTSYTAVSFIALLTLFERFIATLWREAYEKSRPLSLRVAFLVCLACRMSCSMRIPSFFSLFLAIGLDSLVTIIDFIGFAVFRVNFYQLPQEVCEEDREIVFVVVRLISFLTELSIPLSILVLHSTYRAGLKRLLSCSSRRSSKVIFLRKTSFNKRASFRNALGTNVRTSGTNMDDYFKELEAVWETKAYTKK